MQASAFSPHSTAQGGEQPLEEQGVVFALPVVLLLGPLLRRVQALDESQESEFGLFLLRFALPHLLEVLDAEPILQSEFIHGARMLPLGTGIT